WSCSPRSRRAGCGERWDCSGCSCLRRSWSTCSSRRSACCTSRTISFAAIDPQPQHEERKQQEAVIAAAREGRLEPPPRLGGGHDVAEFPVAEGLLGQLAPGAGEPVRHGRVEPRLAAADRGVRHETAGHAPQELLAPAAAELELRRKSAAELD